ncbi:hypothetical protein PInf_000220 [Phytophthora infestans]|nr:hypothetical protein PInf_000220 [Phytophthora infestans]
MECSPGGGASSDVDSSGRSLRNGPALVESQGLEAVSPRRLSRSSSSKTFNRSSSDSDIRAVVAPFPSGFDAQQELEANVAGVHRDTEKPTRAEESFIFLNASMQLMHLNGEARQRVRQLWTSVQRLGRENQISEAGMDVLYVELGNLIKTLSAEKLDATNHLKSGRLVLLASSPASDPGVVGGSTAVKALFGARPTAQLMQCSLSEDQSRFEMTPVRQAPAAATNSASISPNPPGPTLGRFTLPSKASLMGMISDAFQSLQRHFPVSVSLSWLRNRLDQSTLQRRASASLSMIQIVKDLDRDKVLLDGHLFSAANPFEDFNMESDSVSEVVKYMVRKVLTFEQETTSQYRIPGATQQPSSPAHRFANNCEARALAFVERVLQGSSRTQSGGDIYDAISFFCQQEHVSICPVSQDARPVQVRTTSDISKGIFQVQVHVCMQFKVIELTPRSPTPVSPSGAETSSVLDSTAMDSSSDSVQEWAVLEGILSRQFTLGQLCAPGTVTISCI